MQYVLKYVIKQTNIETTKTLTNKTKKQKKGCGKTSFAQVLASELKLDICILNLSNQNLTDNSLAENLREAPKDALILMEDIDAIFVERNNTGICLYKNVYSYTYICLYIYTSLYT